MNTLKRYAILIACILLTSAAYSQTDADEKRNVRQHLSSKGGQTTLGLGLGLPYGALGVRFGVNVINALNLFGGLGYQVAGVGYNIGLLKDFASSSMTQFYLTGMYGTNAAIKINGLLEYNKVYTGPTFGLGIKINSRKTEGNYWDVGLLVPIRSEEYQSAVNNIERIPNLIDFQKPLPVLILVGYNFNL